MVYQFTTGNTFKGIKNAQEVGETLEQLRLINDGKLLTETILETAADPESILHPAFTWDDAKAAHNFRGMEAGGLISAVCVVSKEGQKVPAFISVHINPDEGPAESFYQSISVVTKKPDQYQSAINSAQHALESAQHQLELLLAIAPVAKQPKIQRATVQLEKAQKNIAA